jgi:hypothetical protein
MDRQLAGSKVVEFELLKLHERFVKAEPRGTTFRNSGVRMYLERKIRELDAELALVGRCRLDAGMACAASLSPGLRDP